ncbi:C39 family peptidase [Lactococcus nasutitermitis]|uniref:C39 family peptidase n=1 Tax=Lactococcus nasutitermitis TaxID=1652957 RepID=A0ABV9JG14_9LACT|nr:C39 family peptidase [Lactococcus nasutitermitis]
MKKIILLVVAVITIIVGFGCTVSEAGAATLGVKLYRMYNLTSGEHFYTENLYEAKSLQTAGWSYEGTESMEPSSGQAVYRLYNLNSGVHFYTVNSYEKGQLVAKGWRYEGIAFYSGGSVTLYRAYNPNNGQHNYTTSSYEQQSLVNAGWNNEGLGFKALALGNPKDGDLPLGTGVKNYILMTSGSVNQNNIGAYQACEACALYNGLVAIGKTQGNSVQYLINQLPHSQNPNIGYVGNPYDSLASGYPGIAYVMWAPALAKYATRFDSAARDISGSSMATIEKYVLAKRPVIIYGTLQQGAAKVVNGNYYGGRELSNSHTYLIDGYNATTGQFHITDSIYGKYWKSVSAINAAYVGNNSGAVVL